MDASINRSLEGLRVCEDLLRFYSNDDSASKIKDLRHKLVAAAGTLSRDGLLAAREVTEDKQKFFNLESEFNRESPGDVFTANIRRAAEAVRSLEELSKLEPGGAGPQFQEIRFRIYELEKENWFVLKKIRLMESFRKSLYCIADTGFLKVKEIPGAVIEMAAGGADIIQLRMKGEGRRKILSAAREVSEICRENGVLFVVNDHPDIAALVEADALHLGQDDLPVDEVRRFLPPGTVIGLSTHSALQAREAARLDPDYIAIGPVFDTASKTGETIEGIGLDVVAEVIKESSRPVVAIGGISRDNIQQVLDTGCSSTAVISDIFREGSIRENCRNLSSIVKNSGIKG